MKVPESWIERLLLLEALKEDWEPVPRAVLIMASAFYALFLVQVAQGSGVAQWMDLVFVPIHEGGHLLFRFFGEFLNVAGGTITQTGVPLLLAIYLILVGLMALVPSIALPPIVMGILALAAGVLILIGK